MSFHVFSRFFTSSHVFSRLGPPGNTGFNAAAKAASILKVKRRADKQLNTLLAQVNEEIQRKAWRAKQVSKCVNVCIHVYVPLECVCFLCVGMYQGVFVGECEGDWALGMALGVLYRILYLRVHSSYVWLPDGVACPNF